MINPLSLLVEACEYLADGARAAQQPKVTAQEVGDVLAAIDVLVYRSCFTDEELRTAKFRRLIELKHLHGDAEVLGVSASTGQPYAGVSG